jgi:gliding motility-associated-like protein
MKNILFLFLLFSFTCFSQQEFEICDNSNTVTYYTSIDIIGTIEWFLNGYSLGNGDNMSITYDQPGDYQIVAIGYNDLGCPGPPVVYNVSVTKCDPLIYWVPNSFTPDGNEFNQTWGPVITSGISVENFELTVYNRWGNIVWQSKNTNSHWDGTYNGSLVPDGTYPWIMKIDLLETDEFKVISGFVTIIK